MRYYEVSNRLDVRGQLFDPAVASVEQVFEHAQLVCPLREMSKVALD